MLSSCLLPWSRRWAGPHPPPLHPIFFPGGPWKGDRQEGRPPNEEPSRGGGHLEVLKNMNINLDYASCGPVQPLDVTAYT